jgi:hypothetical protein
MATAEAKKEKHEEKEAPKAEEPMRECERQGFMETLITHPLRHLLSPGAGNKVEAGFGIAGRGAVGYGIVKGIVYAVARLRG